MENILSYVIVFGLIIAGVSVWQLRKSKARPYVLSIQNYPGLQLQIIIQKQEGKTKNLVVQLKSSKGQHFEHLFVELISKKRVIKKMDYEYMQQAVAFPFSIPKNQLVQLKYPFDAFKKYLQQSGFKFSSFRVVIEDQKGKKYKSHEMAFNKNWVIYRPDTGSYN